MNKRQIKKNIQNWYNDAVWYGYANTPIGKLFELEIQDLSNQLGIKLIYPTCL